MDDIYEKKLYKFEYSVPRGGSVCGLFLEKPEVVAEIKEEEPWFYEMFGKHSEVQVDMSEAIEKVPLPIIEYLEWFEEEFGESFGVDPRDHIYDDEGWPKYK